MGGGASKRNVYADASMRTSSSERDARTQFLLRERIKEMRCMYALSNLIATGKEAAFAGVSTLTTFKAALELIPPAWLYPDTTSAHIIMDEKLSLEISHHGKSLRALHKEASLSTTLLLTPFAEQPDLLVSNILCEGQKVGRLEVRVHEKHPDATGQGSLGPFLAEEKVLLDDICRKISEFLTSLNRTEALVERKKVRSCYQLHYLLSILF